MMKTEFADSSARLGAIPSPRGRVLDRAGRMQDRPVGDGWRSAKAVDGETLILDDRSGLSPGQMVEEKLTRRLKGSVPVSLSR
jgi:hypothetical protein